MKITRDTVRLALYITGPLVLLSYVIGVGRMSSPEQLWGGIPESWRTINTATMFVAATGFLITWWFLLYKWDEAAVETVQWPWTNGTNGGHGRLMQAFMLITIPSMLWLELTGIHIRVDSVWTQWLVIGNLWLVCLGNILLGLFAYRAHQQGIATNTIWPIIGSAMLALQVVINDGFLWNLKYPW